jgi:hypothetical protein
MNRSILQPANRLKFTIGIIPIFSILSSKRDSFESYFIDQWSILKSTLLTAKSENKFDIKIY